MHTEVLGELHHVAIGVACEQFKRLLDKVRAAHMEAHVVKVDSAYFPGPDGERIELLSYPLDNLYGIVVGSKVSAVGSVSMTGVHQLSDPLAS